MLMTSFVTLCRNNAQDLPKNLTRVFLLSLVGNAGMLYFTQGHHIPDAMFGFSYPQIHNLFYETWGEPERQRYVKSAWIDILLYMPCYTVALGMLLYWAASQTRGWGSPDQVCLLCLPTLLLDVVETSLLQHACRVGHTTEWQVQIASWANQCKWTSGFGCGLLILLAWLYPRKQASVSSVKDA